jgi:hypothetical protein
MVLDVTTTRLALGGSARAVRQPNCDRVCEGFAITRSDHRACRWRNRLGDPTHVRSDNATGACHRLEGSEGHAFPTRRDNHDVGGGEPRRDIVAFAG